MIVLIQPFGREDTRLLVFTSAHHYNSAFLISLDLEE